MDLSFDWIRNQDVNAWSELTNLLAIADATDEVYGPEDLLEELHEPGKEPELDTVAIWTEDKLVGFGQVRVGQQLREGQSRVSIDGGVHPDYRGQGIGSSLMNLLEKRGIIKAALMHPGSATAFDMWGNAPGHSAGIMAEARGYLPVRYFQDMTVTVVDFRKETERQEAQGPVSTLPFSPEWSERVRLLDNEAFLDHWGSTPKTAEEWDNMISARSFRAERSRILVSNDQAGDAQRVLSYVLVSEWSPGELYVARVGSARDSRGKGYAARVLSEVVDSALEDDFSKVELSVDAHSPTGAVGLYARLGFSVTRTNVVYRKTVFPS